MKNSIDKSVALIGDKTLKTPDDSPDKNLLNVIRTELQLTIDDLCKEGKYIFLTTLEPGFGMLAAEVVLECATHHKFIELHAVIPFLGQELYYSAVDRLRYKRIYESATSRVCLNEKFCEDAFAQQIEYIISASSEVVLFNRESNSDIKKLAGAKAWNMYKELEDYFSIEHPAKTFLQDYPNISSFQYGREGVIFERDGRILPVKFEQMAKIERAKDTLCFFLHNNLTFFASLTSNEVRVSFPRFKGDC